MNKIKFKNIENLIKKSENNQKWAIKWKMIWIIQIICIKKYRMKFQSFIFTAFNKVIKIILFLLKTELITKIE